MKMRWGPLDPVGAFFWYSLAAEEKLLDKPGRLDGLKAKLTPQQVSEALERVKEWRLTHPLQLRG